MYPELNTKHHLVERLQFWSSGEYRVILLLSDYSQVHSHLDSPICDPSIGKIDLFEIMFKVFVLEYILTLKTLILLISTNCLPV